MAGWQGETGRGLVSGLEGSGRGLVSGLEGFGRDLVSGLEGFGRDLVSGLVSGLDGEAGRAPV